MKKFLFALPVLFLAFTACEKKETTPPPPSRTADSSSDQIMGATDEDTSTRDLDQDDGMSDSDRVLHQKIQDSIKNDPALSPLRNKIIIIVLDRNVTLQGNVGSEQDKSKVADKIKRVSGVRNVNNQISVSKSKNNYSNY